MASNYSLQVENVRFDPTRLLALEAQNIANAETEHRAAEAAYGEIQSKADMFEKLANDVRGKDSQAYQNYINYANTLRQHTDLLATQGVNPALWRNLLQAKSDYSRIIHPIEEAYQARDKEAERQAKYLEQHPHAMFERDAYDMGIDQWMKNPHYRAKSIDREVVANRAMERYKALQSQIMEMVSQSGLTPDAIKRMTPTQVHAYVKQTAPWLYEAMEKRGVSPEEVQRFMTGDSTAINSLLTSVMDETLGMYGLNTWNTDYDHYTAEQNRLRRNDIHNILRSTVEGEAPNAIGESKFTPYTDSISGDLAYKYAALEEQKRHNQELENAARGKGNGDGGDDTPKQVYTFYNTNDETTVDEDIETTKADNLRMLSDLISAEPRLDEYDYSQLMKGFKKLYGDSAKDMMNQLKTRPELVDVVAQSMFEYFGKDGILTKGRRKNNEFTLPFGFTNETYDASFTDEDKADKSDFTVNDNDFSKLTNGQLYNAYEATRRKILKDISDKYYPGGNTTGSVDPAFANEADYNILKSIINEILSRKKSGVLDSRIKKELKKLVKYDNNSDLSIYGATDDYIGDAAITSTTSHTNYEGQSAKVFMDNVAEIIRQNPNNTGITLDGKKQNLSDLQTLLSMNDKTGDYYYTPQFYLKPVKGKDGTWSHKFGFTDKNGQWYDVAPDFFSGVTKNARKVALANMNDYLNKMNNYKLTEKDKKNVDEAVDNYFKSAGISNPSNKQKALIRDMYVRQIKEQVRRMYEQSYEENRTNYWGHLFDETHNTNTMSTIAEQHTNKSKVDPEYNYGQTGN